MSTLSLYSAAVLIWGSTWLAIKFQLGEVAPAVSVAYRFGLAALMLLAWCRWQRLSLKLPFNAHVSVAALGLMLFGLNYVLVYESERFLNSGVVAVVFSLIVFLNLIGMRLFFGTPIAPRVLVGAVAGVLGVLLLFWPEVAHFGRGSEAMLGLTLALGSTVVAAGGNLIAYRNKALALPLPVTTGYGMAYGAGLVAAYVMLSGTSWTMTWSLPYVSSLLYLTVFGSVAAFLSYLTLIQRIGADRAGYVGVLVPMVALVMSTLFEGYRWHPEAAAGLVLCLAGNVLVLWRVDGPTPVPCKSRG
ncbi:MAG: DMT family transporter [Betaproteobacteria bacterium]|nr:DMT family transporter [Betaproteobacteria bacterium]